MRGHKDSGLSLIELVVAMAVFALVAIMGLQSLTGMLRNRDHLVELSENTHELGQAVALLRNDLSALVPFLFFPPERQAPQSALRLTGSSTRLSLSIAGQPSLGANDQLGAMHRSEWRYDGATNTLSRAVWPTLIPARPNARSSEVVILREIDGFSARSYWPVEGWINGLRQPNSANTTTNAIDSDQTASSAIVYSSTLPLAVEITLHTQEFGDIPLVHSLR
ncbi:type II secretion system protein GspJ [Planktotalea sp.]|uniref:type II secretion system protein GspJ n=1 Tax=Planktotalea sp. TaxID=2029877 RepID=UPI0032973A27